LTINDIITLLPMIVIAATAVLVMMLIAVYRSHGLTVLLTLAGIGLSFASFMRISSLLPRLVTSLLIIDHYAVFYMGLVLASGFIVTLLSYGYLNRREVTREEFYILLLLSILGSEILVAASHFVTFFLGLEILSVSLYAMTAYLRDERGIEAGIKYLVLASSSAAFLLFGMALIYAETGTMSFAALASGNTDLKNGFLLSGIAMIIVGAGFKLAVAPFHLWTPDVYEGAPATVTAFIATASKGAVFAFLLRYFNTLDIGASYPLFLIFSGIAVASMFTGNILALFQKNVKRVLAYSSIAHLGYLLVAFLAARAYSFTAVTFYLVAYFVTTMGAFGTITVMSSRQRDADMIDDYQGMAWRHPWLAAVFTAMFFSLAGIPLTAGFIGKFYILKAGAGSSLWLLVIILIINSAIGLFYYLRVVIAMFIKPSENEVSTSSFRISLIDKLTLALLMLFLFWIGTYPSLFIDIIESIGSTVT
jgi:NADH-quinone oxidoreductase subunit N